MARSGVGGGEAGPARRRRCARRLPGRPEDASAACARSPPRARRPGGTLFPRRQLHRSRTDRKRHRQSLLRAATRHGGPARVRLAGPARPFGVSAPPPGRAAHTRRTALGQADGRGLSHRRASSPPTRNPHLSRPPPPPPHPPPPPPRTSPPPPP